MVMVFHRNSDAISRNVYCIQQLEIFSGIFAGVDKNSLIPGGEAGRRRGRHLNGMQFAACEREEGAKLMQKISGRAKSIQRKINPAMEWENLERKKQE